MSKLDHFSFPWDSHTVTIDDDGYPRYDRAWSARHLRMILGEFFSDGVWLTNDGNALNVVEGEDMTVYVSAGVATVRSTDHLNDSPWALRVDDSDPQPRIDRVVLRWDSTLDNEFGKEDIYPLIIKGEPSTSPVAPDLLRTEDRWDLGLATIYVDRYAEEVTQADITDTRLDSRICGKSEPFYRLDLTNLFIQYQSKLMQSVGTLTARAYDELNRLLEMNNRLTDENGGCGCEGEIDDLRALVLKVYYDLKDDIPYFAVGKTIYTPKGEASYDDMTLSLEVATAEVGEDGVLALIQAEKSEEGE